MLAFAIHVVLQGGKTVDPPTPYWKTPGPIMWSFFGPLRD